PLAIHARYQTQETQHRQRQGGIDVELLRHIADAQLGLAPDLAAIRLEQAQHHPHQSRLAGAVGADQGDDLTTVDLQVRAFQDVLAGEAHVDVLQSQQRLTHAARRQGAQRPTTSTVWPSTLKSTVRAALTMASAIAGCSSSMAVWQPRQIRNCPWCGCSGRLQPIKALSDAMRCTRPFSRRKSSAR